MAYLVLKYPLILASSSARRCELLNQIGLNFTCISPDIDERIYDQETASDYVYRLAQQKAQAVLVSHQDSIILAADTTVCIDQEIITQATCQSQAFEIWSKLAGRTHEVLTGVCVAYQDKILTQVVSTEVTFKQLTAQEMQDYWSTGEPLGKAGAYAIQGIAGQFISDIRGSYTNVVGLPLYETVQLLKKI